MSLGEVSRRRGIFRHAHVFSSFALCLLVLAWFTTWGDGRLFDAERFGGYYDAQARAILHGRLDVPPEAIGFEAFVRDGKSYGYFGIAPALLRVPLLLLFPHMDGHWSRLMMLIGAGLSILYAYRLLLLFRGSQAGDPAVDRLFVLAAGLGSTLVFLVSRSYTYHEAILWGATFAVMFGFYVIRYLLIRDARSLLLAGACCFFSFMSRATAGAGTLLVMCLISAILAKNARASSKKVSGTFFAQREKVPDTFFDFWGGFSGAHFDENAGPIRSSHALIAFIFVLLTVGTYLSINYAKFRTFDGVPVRYYSLYIKDPQRMAVTGGKQIHLFNLRTTLLAYLGPAGAQIGPEFPWIYMRSMPRIFSEARIDVVEPHASLLWCMPALLLLAMIGCREMIGGSCTATEKGYVPFSSARLPAVGLLSGGGVIFLTVGITQRYLHDLYPFLIVAGAAGASHLSLCARSFSLFRPPVLRGRVRAGVGSRPQPVSHSSISEQTPTPALPWSTGRGSKKSQVQISLLALLVIMSILFNAAFAFDFQREIVWGIPREKRAQLNQMRASIDAFLHRPPPAREE